MEQSKLFVIFGCCCCCFFFLSFFLSFLLGGRGALCTEVVRTECWRGVCKGVGCLLEGEGGTLSMRFYNIQLAFRVVPISRMLTHIKEKVTKPRSQGMVGSEGYRSFTSAEP